MSEFFKDIQFLVQNHRELGIVTSFLLGFIALIIFIAKQIGLRQMKKMLHHYFPKTFQADEFQQLQDEIKDLKNVVNGLHHENIHLRKNIQESNSYIEKTLRDIRNKL